VRHEYHADAVLAWFGQLDPRLFGHQFQKIVRRLNQNACPIARVRLAAASAAVIQIQQYFQRLLDDRVRLASLDIDDKSDAARFVFELWIV